MLTEERSTMELRVLRVTFLKSFDRRGVEELMQAKTQKNKGRTFNVHPLS